ncbi:hypothetical protein [Paenibacillus sp. DMB20]|uniref:hypothetical protein n=1 Tax=Paenibacillus sp. DMB20 TaxID=1642570 RepID=UPI000627A207|nr:hypothetical protein [Paenibacillus sp. DMB20]KKO52330.1 hypothetical protein XI25_19165 [Paenibacillus sp. DMB20]
MTPSYLLRKFHRSSFRSKLVLTYVFIIVIPVISAMFLSGMQLYKQTHSDYEEILKQLDKRTNVTINEFFTNQARYSFFLFNELETECHHGKKRGPLRKRPIWRTPITCTAPWSNTCSLTETSP